MAPDPTHYDTLEVSPTATQAQIKQAYRRLVKQCHPDRHGPQSHDRAAALNAAYEVVGDPQRRERYDRQLREPVLAGGGRTRERRNAEAGERYRRRQTGRDADDRLDRWLKQVYCPVNHLLHQILHPLDAELAELAGDPFDDELMDGFLAYLDDCRDWLGLAKQSLRSMPNPPAAARAAAHLYYCLDRVDDGLDELAYFPLNYDESRIHDGQEMFRIAEGLRWEAQDAVRTLVP